MIEGGFHLGPSEEEEYGGRVPKVVDDLANRLARKYGVEVEGDFVIDDEEMWFGVRAAIWSAVVEAAIALQDVDRSDWGGFGTISQP